MRRTALLIGLGVLALLAQSAPAANVDLFILAGQSNAGGHPTYPADNPPILPSDSAILFEDFIPPPASSWGSPHTQPGTWDTLAIRYNNVVGPEEGIGRTLQAGLPGQKIAILKFAVGGTSIRDWERQDHSDEYWTNSAMLYPDLISEIQAAEARILAAGDTPVLSGMFWMQGENGATVPYSSQVWATDPNNPDAWTFRDHTKQFFTDVRSDLGVPNMPIMEGRISDTMYQPAILQDSATAYGVSVDVISRAVDHQRQQQEAVAAQLPNTYLVSEDGMLVYPGEDPRYSYHFTPSSYIVVGDRMGQTYLNATPEPATLSLLILGGLAVIRRRRA